MLTRLAMTHELKNSSNFKLEPKRSHFVFGSMQAIKQRGNMMSTSTAKFIEQCRLLLIFALSFAASLSVAAPQIAIEFEQEQGSNNEWIRAKANCYTTEPRLYEVLNAIVKYPELHGWIRDTKIESNTMNVERQILVEFQFPWPVGKQWSRIEVKGGADSSISWRQLEGTLKMNQGRIVITEHKQQAHLDYRAIIDVGYPNAFTRSYKKKFVLEFLRAIYDETRGFDQPSTETPASSSQSIVATLAP